MRTEFLSWLYFSVTSFTSIWKHQKFFDSFLSYIMALICMTISIWCNWGKRDFNRRRHGSILRYYWIRPTKTQKTLYITESFAITAWHVQFENLGIHTFLISRHPTIFAKTVMKNDTTSTTVITDFGGYHPHQSSFHLWINLSKYWREQEKKCQICNKCECFLAT